MPRVVKFIEPKGRMLISKGEKRQRNKEFTFTEDRVSLWEDGKPPGGGDDCIA